MPIKNPCCLSALLLLGDLKNIIYIILAIFFSQGIRIFKSNQAFFFSVFFSSTGILQPKICQTHTGVSWATSHVIMKARKERTRWHQKIGLSRSLVVKLAIWLPAGRLWEKGWRIAKHHCKGRRILPYSLQSQGVHCSWKCVPKSALSTYGKLCAVCGWLPLG